MIKIFFVKDANIFLNNEQAKRAGFKFEKSTNMNIDKEDGFYFWFNADEEFYNLELFKNKEIKEVSGEKKEHVLTVRPLSFYNLDRNTRISVTISCSHTANF